MTVEEIANLKEEISDEEIFRLAPMVKEEHSRDSTIPEGKNWRDILTSEGYNPELASYIYDHIGTTTQILQRIKTMDGLRKMVDSIETRRIQEMPKKIYDLKSDRGLPSPADGVLDERAKLERIQNGENPDLDL